MSAGVTTTTLAALCELVSTQVAPQEQTGAVYLGLEHLASGRFEPIGRGTAAEVSSSKFTFQTGDILYGKLRPYLDKAVFANCDGVCTTELLVLRPRPGISGRYLACVVHSPEFIRHAMAGTTGAHHPRTSWHHIRDFEVLDFSPSEREAIATIVWTAHDALVKCELAMTSAERLKRVAMHELFARGLHGETQKDSDIGLVPETWTREELSNVAEISYGAQAAVANATDPLIGTLILTNVNISSDGRIDLDKRRYFKVPDSQRQRLILQKGDVLFNWRSGSAAHVGKTAYFDLDGEFTYSSFILRLRANRCVSGRFLFWYLSQLRANGYFISQTNVSSINSVFNASLASTIPIWFPDPDGQLEIVEILNALEKKIAIHRKRLDVLGDLFRSLIQDLITGSVSGSAVNLSELNDSIAQVSA